MLPTNEDPRAFFQNPKYTRDQEDTLEFVKKLRKLVDEFEPSRFLVGEVYASIPILKKYLGENNDGLNLVFLFQALDTPLRANPIRKLIKRFETNFVEPLVPTWVFSNHDRVRRITKLNDDLDKAKLNATLQMTARGVPFIYYGEEIGMTQHQIPIKDAQDPLAIKYKWIPAIVLNFIRKFFGESINRDECRTPMQWDSSPNAGFCAPNITPWLPITSTFKERNVAVETKDPNSLLNCYRQLLKLRRKYPSLNAGNLELLDMDNNSDSIVGYVRQANLNGYNEVVHIYLNFTDRLIKFQPLCKNPKLLFCTSAKRNSVQWDMISMNSLEGMILLQTNK
jgi:oligo-1,6-glucosidase/alpha-glucosidase